MKPTEPGNSSPASPGRSQPSWTVQLEERFLRRLAKGGLTAGELGLVDRAIARVAAQFGRPHEHSGLGIRRMKGDISERRVGSGIRLLFRSQPHRLMFFFAGNHDEFRREIQRL